MYIVSTLSLSPKYQLGLVCHLKPLQTLIIVALLQLKKYIVVKSQNLKNYLKCFKRFRTTALL